MLFFQNGALYVSSSIKPDCRHPERRGEMGTDQQAINTIASPGNTFTNAMHDQAII